MAYGRADFELNSYLQPFNRHNDFAYHPTYLNNSNLPDYTYPHYRADYVFVTYNPSKVEPVYNLLRVFDAGTWLCTMLSLIVVTLVYSTICRMRNVDSFLN